jgi:hypothetical protein
MTRRKKHILIAIAWLAMFFLTGLIVWGFQGGELMLLVYMALSAIVYVLYAFLARCHSCGKPVLLRPLKLLGMELYVWSILTPKQCRHCGASIP